MSDRIDGPPTEPGKYWIWTAHHADPDLVEVMGGQYYHFGNDTAYDATEIVAHKRLEEKP